MRDNKLCVPQRAQDTEASDLNAAICDFLSDITGGVLGGDSCESFLGTFDWMVSVLTMLPLVGGFLAVLATLFMSLF